MLELLKELNTNAHKTIALVIHDLNLAARFSDWMIAMRKGEVLYRGTPKEIMTNQVLRDVFSLDAYIAQDPWDRSAHLHDISPVQKIKNRICFLFNVIESRNNRRQEKQSV